MAMLWVIHHSIHRPAPAVTPAIWEQAIPARHFFSPERLLVASWNGEPVAWCHWFLENQRSVCLAAFCFDASPQGETAAVALLTEFQRQVVSAGVVSIHAGISPESRWGYQGLDPIGQGIGIDVADDRVNQLLEDAGFEEARRIDRWEVATIDYRPPVSRESVLFRRGTRIELAAMPPMTPDQAAAMFHLEIKKYQLVAPGGGTPLATAEIWLSDPDIHVMSTNHSILGRVDSDKSDLSAREAAIRCLLALIIPLLAEKQIRSLYHSVPSDSHDVAARMAALKFRRTAVGRLLRKSL